MSRYHQMPRPVSSSNISALRLGTPEVSATVRERRVAQLPISQNLDEFEVTLQSLLTSISRYSPSVSDAEKLLEIESRLTVSLDNIIAHQRAGLDIDSLEQQSSILDSNCREIIIGLSDCRKKLMALPSLERVQNEKKSMYDEQIKAEDLLSYAMKLAKFTTAPATFDTGAIGPNNFIWPAEDSLRRGMLAIASLNEDELLGIKPDVSKDGENNKGEEDESTQNRRGSFGTYGGNDDGDDGANVIEDLDLFDMDD